MSLSIRTNLLRAMYLYSVVGAGGFGLALLLNQGPFASADPFTSATLGCFEIALAAIALLGLRAPLKFIPALALQLIYKSLWFALVFFPALITGNAPGYASILAVVFATFILGDLIAIPFVWLLAVEKPVALADTLGDNS